MERDTRPARMYDDTADMVAWILKLEGKGETVAEFLEKLVRKHVEKRYEPLRERVEKIKALSQPTAVGA